MGESKREAGKKKGKARISTCYNNIHCGDGKWVGQDNSGSGGEDISEKLTAFSMRLIRSIATIIIQITFPRLRYAESIVTLEIALHTLMNSYQAKTKEV